jgi:hypothetical protein
MSFFSEKWKNSSVLTKAALVAMLVNTLLLLVGVLIAKSWDKSVSPENRGIWVFFFITFLFNLLLTFGIFRVNGIAKGFTILQGLVAALFVVLFIANLKYTMTLWNDATRAVYGDAAVDAAASAASAAVSSGLVASLVRSAISAIPRNVLAQIGFYLIIFLGPYVFQLLSMLILLVCGKDFKKPKVEAS